jgi:hypothetical protein
MDVAAVREHFRVAQGAGAQRQSALAVRTRSGVAINVWRTYGARLRAGGRPRGAQPRGLRGLAQISAGAGGQAVSRPAGVPRRRVNVSVLGEV